MTPTLTLFGLTWTVTERTNDTTTIHTDTGGAWLTIPSDTLTLND